MCAQSFSHVRPFVTLWTVPHQAPLFHGILQARLLEWVAMPSLQGTFLTQGSKSHLPSSPALQADSLLTEQPGKPQTKAEMKVKVAQLCPTLCDLMDYTVHGILQARILEWVAFPFSRGSSQLRGQTQVSHIAGGFFTS